MKNAPNLPVHCEKVLSKTYKLSLEELGALFRLMMVTWNNKGEALPDDPDEMARSLTCTKDRWLKKLRPRLLPMFDLSEGTWKLTGPTSPMDMDEQWNWVQNNIRIKTANGARGGRPPAQKVAGDLENLSTELTEQFVETQTAKSLENMETAKPVGFDSVNLNESTATVTKESKKESPLSPPKGAVDMPGLFPVQEVQHAPVRDDSGPRRKRNGSQPIQPVSATPEIEAAFQEFRRVYPSRNYAHTWTLAKPLFVAAVKSGVSAETIIHTAGMYAKIVRAEGKEGDSSVADARTWLFQRRWENYADFQPILKPKTHGNVTPMRASNNGQVPNEYIRRGGRQG
jgi:uncharacterized protein YdaU (DUF1376 family)